MARKIQVKRGDSKDLPALAAGELGLCMDTGQLYVGGKNGNTLVGGGTRVYREKFNSWDTCMLFGDYMVANVILSKSGLTADKTTIPTSIYKTPTLYLPTPLPITSLAVSATCDRRGQYVSNVEHVSGGATVGLKYKVYDPTNPTTISSYIRMVLFGRIAKPPAAPTVAENTASGSEIVDIAETYVTAQLGGRVFKYGANFFYGSGSYNINNEAGQALMECDTYVGMVLRGVRYADSPFAVLTPNYNMSYADMMANSVHSTSAWCTSLRDMITGTDPQNILGRDIKYASDLGWLAWSRSGRVFSDPGEARPGDVAIWKRPDNTNFFDNIGHVAIVGRNGYLYEVTSAGNSGGKVLQKILMSQKAEQPSYFARLY